METKLETRSDPVDLPQVALGNTARASWPFSLDHIRAATAAYSTEAQELLARAFLWCTDEAHPITKPDFAARVDSSDNTIYKIYTGRYTHPETKATLQPSPKLLAAIATFLDIERKRHAFGKTPLVETPTLRQIETACQLARTSQTICFIVGPSHIGKTWALEDYYTPKYNHGTTIYTRMEAASGLLGMVRAMARSLRLPEEGSITDIIHRIKAALTKDMVWILDEVHLLAHTYRKGAFHNCMEVIRDLHDTKKIGMVLCFTLLDEVRAASQKELQQLWRRGVHKIILPNMPTIGDLTAILASNGLAFPAADLKVKIRFRTDAGDTKTIEEEPRKILRQVAKDEALLAVTERLRYAKVLAKKAGKPLDWSHFVEAHLRIAKQAQPPEDWI
ncbi:MAG: ATP-binding protein [Verrucomicrobiota bacterium]|jgi:DNA transposition AAA+ family ATPase